MSLHRPLLPILSKSLLCIAIAGTSVSMIVGCSSEVGSSPSSKQQVAEALARDAEKNPTRKGRGGKSVPAPQNIKQKVISIKTEDSKS